jgi:signal transduction histidine kinase
MVDMEQPFAIRDALRIFRFLLVVQLAFLGLTFLARLQFEGPGRLIFLLRAAPTLLLTFLFLPPWLEQVLGRYFLAAGLGLNVLFSSLEMAYLFVDWPIQSFANYGLSSQVVEQLAAAPPVEPFFFLLIPLVLLAWGYGRRGALLGSTWAAILHLGIGLGLSPHDGRLALFLAQMVTRIALLYLVPLLVSILAVRERRQHAELEAAHQRLRRHAATVEQLAISRERNRMARELHDTLAHSLSALTVQLEALRTLLAHDPADAREAVIEIAALSRRGLEESRRAIQALRTDPVETLGLAGALRDALQAFQVRTGVVADLTVAGRESDLTTEEAQTLFRITEEALNNVERHAAARRVGVRLAFGADRIDLVIRDDGVGFDPTTVNPDRYGLTGMRERAMMIGGEIKVTGSPGGGTEVGCSVER